jgi:hypothetical protein
MGVLANEYVRRLSAEQFAEPRRDVRAPQRDDTCGRRRVPRRRLTSRGFRRLDIGVRLHRRHARRAARAVPRDRKGVHAALREMRHFDGDGHVVGGDLYYDRVSLLIQLSLMP